MAQLAQTPLHSTSFREYRNVFIPVVAGLSQHQEKEQGHVLPVLLLTSPLSPDLVWGMSFV